MPADAARNDPSDRDVRDRLFREHLAAELRAVAARQKISAAQLAKNLGEPPQWGQRRLSGERDPNTSDLTRIARELGVSLRDLVTNAWDSAYAEVDRPTGPRHRR